MHVDAHGEPRDDDLAAALHAGPRRRRCARRLTKWATLGIAAVLFVVAMMLAPLLPTAFIDAGGENFLTVTVSPPQGASTAGVAGEDHRGRGHPPRRRRRRARAVDHPGRGRHRRPGPPVGLRRARLQQRGPDHPAGRRRRPRRGPRGASSCTSRPVSKDGFEVAVSEQDFTGAGGSPGRGQRPGRRRHQGRQRRHRARAAACSTARQRDQRRGRGGAADRGGRRPQRRRTHRLDDGPGRAAHPQRSGRPVHRQLRARATAHRSSRHARRRQRRGRPRRACARCPSAARTGVVQPLDQVADVDQVEVRGTVTRVDGAPAATVSADITSEDTGAVSRAAAAGHRRPARGGRASPRA